jgi:hypothetical protein
VAAFGTSSNVAGERADVFMNGGALDVGGVIKTKRQLKRLLRM